jgi:hypothetical protein
MRLAMLFTFLLTLAIASLAADAPAIPPIVGQEYLQSWNSGVAQADARQDPLTIVCFGDSNTEAATYTVALRDLLQGRYGDHGIGYHTIFKGRNPVPRGPEMKHEGAWKFFDTSPGRETPPPAPYFALDGFWATTTDPAAAISVSYPTLPGGAIHRNRVHYQVGPGLGAFSIFIGSWEWKRIECSAEKPGYAVTEPFIAEGFKVGKIAGQVTLLGTDADRTRLVRGECLMPGGAFVHALGNGWGQAQHLAPTDEGAFKGFFAATKPDLITIMLGTNDMHNAGVAKWYHTHLTTIIEKLQRAAPGVGILVISCPEAGQTKDGLAMEFAAVAREVAAAQKCAFWDWRQVMGVHSRQAEMMGVMGDGLHYGPLGGGVFANLLLAQLGFDLNDPRHWPALIQPVEQTGRQLITIRRLPNLALDRVRTALKDEPAHPIWHLDTKVADVQVAVAGANLAVHARVLDGRCTADQQVWTGSNLDLYVSKVGSWAGDENEKFRGYHGIVRQLVLKATAPDGSKQCTGHEGGKDTPAPDFPWTVTPLQPAGYQLDALVPLSFFLLDDKADQFYFEAAVVTAPGPGAPVSFNRLFLRGVDGGAFRDNSGAALVTVQQ